MQIHTLDSLFIQCHLFTLDYMSLRNPQRVYTIYTYVEHEPKGKRKPKRKEAKNQIRTNSSKKMEGKEKRENTNNRIVTWYWYRHRPDSFVHSSYAVLCLSVICCCFSCGFVLAVHFNWWDRCLNVYTHCVCVAPCVLHIYYFVSLCFFVCLLVAVWVRVCVCICSRMFEFYLLFLILFKHTIFCSSFILALKQQIDFSSGCSILDVGTHTVFESLESQCVSSVCCMTSFVFLVIEASRIAAGKITERSTRQHDKNTKFLFCVVFFLIIFFRCVYLFSCEFNVSIF